MMNVYAYYVMSKSLKAIKFENLVVFCGILECLILIFVILTDWEFLTLLILFCQVLIYLFILRRFLRIYFRMKKKSYEPKTNCYNLYSKIDLTEFIKFIFENRFFYVNTFINVTLTLSIFILIGFFSNEKLSIILQWVDCLYSLVISLILFYIGFEVRR